MFSTSLLNMLLSVLTLSIYRFWGKTNVRRQLWGAVRAWGDPLEYTGTGKELFIGFLIVLFAIYLPLVGGFAWAQVMLVSGNPLGALLLSGLYLLTVMLVSVGLYRARRYQMSRTVWRGIRGGQTGSGWSYALRTLVVWIAVPLSLGWAWPWGEMWLANYRFNNTTFGDRHFKCDATASGLYGRFTLVWFSGLIFVVAAGILAVGAASLVEQGEMDETTAAVAFALVLVPLAVLTMALPSAWYRAGFYRNLAAGTEFEGSRFSVDIRAWGLIGLVAGNMLISLFSLGVLRPMASLRTFRYGCSVIGVEGEPDFAKVLRAEDTGPSTGEGLVAVLDGAGEF
ncbi:Thymidylate kinase [Paramagnetospirillum magnetotacticum MS-1]|uniref:Thymidylate kinase n=2 Tax=Paramagnetospirillum magnetotacticum TaxID=188 RepID=A0A0C2YK27_PARME|nr:Thymidylate kinase [Paramagnetospirillum magnetotacticum MS-1]